MDPSKGDLLLFRQHRAQFPEQKCIIPLSAAAVGRGRRGRRLMQMITEEEDEMACAGWKTSDRNDCIYDVLMTGDIEMASAGHY